MARQAYSGVKFTNVPSPLTDEEKSELVGRLQLLGNSTINHNGREITLRDLLIESHMPLVCKVASEYASTDNDNIAGVALLALIEAVDRLECLKVINDQPTAYIMTCVRRQILTSLNTNHLVPVAPDAYKDGSRFGVRVDSYIMENHQGYDDPCIHVDARDVMDACVKTETQRIVADSLLMGGYHRSSLAQQCGVTPARIGQVRKHLTNRFVAKW